MVDGKKNNSAPFHELKYYVGANKIEIAAALNPYIKVTLKDRDEEKHSFSQWGEFWSMHFLVHFMLKGKWTEVRLKQ